jgi:hypothetical protein
MTEYILTASERERRVVWQQTIEPLLHLIKIVENRIFHVRKEKPTIWSPIYLGREPGSVRCDVA